MVHEHHARQHIERMLTSIDAAVAVGVLTSAARTARWLDHVAVHLKHPAFEAEREARLVFATSAESSLVKTRITSGVIRPYIEVRPVDGRPPITSLRLGPKARGKVDQLGVRYLLDSEFGEGHGISVAVSTVPFR